MTTLVDIMLLGHCYCYEIRSVRQASGALDELAKLIWIPPNASPSQNLL